MIKQYRIGYIGNIASKADREKYTGVLRYAATHPDVLIEEFNPTPFSPDISFPLIRRWAPDGIIVSGPAGTAHLPELPDRIPIGLIDNFDTALTSRNVRFSLLPDEARLATFVAHHFLRRHFKSFAYFGYADKDRSHLRQRAFSETVGKKGHDTAVFSVPWSAGSNLSEAETDRLKDFIQHLPFPCAAFVYWDYLAKQVLSCCSRLGIRVPEQLSVISVDNEEFICENTRPTLSSVELDFQSVGYKAAERLHSILAGKKAARAFREIAYGMTRLVERISSSDQGGAVRILAAAREIIRTESCKGLTTALLARRLNISQRYLEMHFKKTLATTPCAEIRKRKIEEAKRLLAQTQMTFDTIAQRAGFRSLHHLQNIFTASVGRSMKAYRRNHR